MLDLLIGVLLFMTLKMMDGCFRGAYYVLEPKRKNMQNIGEEITGEYLRIVRKCDFIQYNLQNPDIQGEIDVVGIDLKRKIVYLCEVAIHLITGLMYVDQKSKQPNNVKKLIQKLEKDRAYALEYFPDYKHVLMIWSPIVRESKEGSKHRADA